MDRFACNKKGEELCTLGTVKVLTQGDGDEEESDFWNYLSGGDGGSDDDKHSRSMRSRGIGSSASRFQEQKNLTAALEEFKPKLFRVDADITTPLQQVSEGEMVTKTAMFTMGGVFEKDSLDDNDVFLLDAGWEIFVWIGKSANFEEKMAAMAAADRYAEMEPRVKDIPLSIVKEGHESSSFWSLFKN